MADLPAGHHLAMGGHHHNIAALTAELVKAGPLAADYPVPFYLLANRVLRRSVRKGERILFADIEISDDSPLLALRRAQDRLFLG